jgi:hypothetical protein
LAWAWPDIYSTVFRLYGTVPVHIDDIATCMSLKPVLAYLERKVRRVSRVGTDTQAHQAYQHNQAYPGPKETEDYLD